MIPDIFSYVGLCSPYKCHMAWNMDNPESPSLRNPFSVKLLCQFSIEPVMTFSIDWEKMAHMLNSSSKRSLQTTADKTNATIVTIVPSSSAIGQRCSHKLSSGAVGSNSLRPVICCLVKIRYEK